MDGNFCVLVFSILFSILFGFGSSVVTSLPVKNHYSLIHKNN